MFLCSVVSSRGAEVDILTTAGRCTAFETEEKVFELEGQEAFILNLNLSSLFREKYSKGYNTFDKGGQKCLKRMEKRINATVSSFRNRVVYIAREKAMLSAYLNESHMMKKDVGRKRSVGGVALALSIFNLIVHGASYAYTDYRLGELRRRLDELDEAINGILTEQRFFQNNQDFLYNEGKVMAVQRKIVVDYINGLEVIHSCELENLNFEDKILRLEIFLDRLIDAILGTKLTRDLIDVVTLSKLTMDYRFHNTLYRVSPLDLYSLSNVYMHSYSETQLTFVVTYPVIGRYHTQKLINLLETSGNMIFYKVKPDLHFQFLMPHDVPIEKMNLSEIGDPNACLKTERFTACQSDAILPRQSLGCLKLLAFGIKSSSCSHGTRETGDLVLSYGQHGVLAQTDGEGKIYEANSDEVLRVFDGRSCIYLPRSQNLVIEINKVKTNLFPEPLVWNGEAALDMIDAGVHIRSMPNLSVPEYKNPVTYKNDTIRQSERSWNYVLFHLTKPWTLVMIIVVFLSLTAMCVIALCCFMKFCKGSDVNVKMNGNSFAQGGIDGGSFR